MFCRECGAQIIDGSKFCENCGAAQAPPRQQAQAPPQQQVPPQQQQPGQVAAQQAGGKGFFSSPGGIALVVVLALLVAAGITVGLVFILKGSSGNAVDAETVRVWDSYEQLLEEDGEAVPKITTDQATLDKSRAELESSQEKLAELRKALANAGTDSRRNGSSTTAKRDVKADQLAASLKAYKAYIAKVNELIAALTGANLLDPNTVNNINRILAELEDMGADVKVTANRFLADNGQVVTVKVDPPILKLAAASTPEIQASVNAAQSAEQQRLAAEKAAADAAAAEAAAEAERRRQEEEAARNQMVTCPNCGGDGIAEGGDGWYQCAMCGGSGVVTREAAENYNFMDWI